MEYVEEYRRITKEAKEIAMEALEAQRRAKELWQRSAMSLTMKGDLLQHMMTKGFHKAVHGRKKHDGSEYGKRGLEYHTV